ncbi:LPS export ABC transporter periplasmic protein LptC [Chromatiales bacterium (ex Bugula neritina AB1)]|nr:LPS export ABC transporter periplasmic protein LptC [Chromatiales bacterium (ex Bugula neritina AB1)]
MPKTLFRTLWVFALMVFAALSWQWLEDGRTSIDPAENTVAMAKNQTDYYLEDFNIVNVDNHQGHVYELHGKTLSHYYNGGNSTVEQPIVRVYGAQQQHWQGSADSGEITADFSTLKLTGNVDLYRDRVSDQAPIQLETESITINNADNTMHTSDTVLIKSENWSFRANRMQADVNSGKLAFDTGVEADYELQ